MGMKDYIVGNISEVGTSILSGFKSIFGIHSPSTVMEEQGDMIVQGLANGIMEMPEKIMETFGNLLTYIQEWGANLGTIVLDAFANLGSMVFEALSSIGQIVQDVFATLGSNIPAFVGNIIPSIIQALQQIPELVGNMFTTLVEFISVTFGEIPARILEFLGQIVTNYLEFEVNMLSYVLNGMQMLYTTVIDVLTTLIPAVWNLLVQVINKVVEMGVQLQAKGRETITKMKNAIIDAAKSLPSAMAEIGRNIVRGVWNGIQAMAGWFHSQVSGFFSGIVNGVKSALGIASPSKVFAEIGRFMAEGVGVGWDNSFENIRSGIEDSLQFGTDSLGISSDLFGENGIGQNGGVVYNQTVNNYSPESLTPWEIERQTRNAAREMLLNIRGV